MAASADIVVIIREQRMIQYAAAFRIPGRRLLDIRPSLSSGARRRPVGGQDRVDQSLRPAALDDLGCALAEQFECDRATEFARAIGGAGARRLDEQATGFIQHRSR